MLWEEDSEAMDDLPAENILRIARHYGVISARVLALVPAGTEALPAT